MKYTELANPGILDQPVYEPGKPIEYVAREQGLPLDGIAKLASNENPHGPSPKAVAAIREAAARCNLYPDGACTGLRAAIAAERGVGEDQVVVGNGSNELIELLGHAFLRPGTGIVAGAQAFVVYKLVARLFGAGVVEVPMPGYRHDLEAMAEAVTPETRIVFVASPNNPTGGANEAAELEAFVDALPEHVIFCFDEAYAEYLESPPDLRPAIARGRKVVCLRTFSKIYGLGGLRVGYAYGDPSVVAILQRARQPFNVNSLAQAAARAALGDRAFVQRCREANERGRRQLVQGFDSLGIECHGGRANFVLVRVGDGRAAFESLQSEGVIVRPLDGYGLAEFIRVTIGRPDENTRVLEAVDRFAASRASVLQ